MALRTRTTPRTGSLTAASRRARRAAVPLLVAVVATGLAGAASASAEEERAAEVRRAQAVQQARQAEQQRLDALVAQQRTATHAWAAGSEQRAVRNAVVAEEVRRAEEARRAEAARLAEEARRAAAEAAVRSAVRDPRGAARVLAGERGWGGEQFSCLDLLWTKESGWSHTADNPTSSAYGIPQALPGSKMASAGADWATNPVTQIRWGLQYIDARYGTPCAAWAHSRANNWY